MDKITRDEGVRSSSQLWVAPEICLGDEDVYLSRNDVVKGHMIQRWTMTIFCDSMDISLQMSTINLGWKVLTWWASNATQLS